MITFKTAENKEDVKMISEITNKIFVEHFIPIIGVTQTTYMLNIFHGERQIEEQINKGFEYIMVYSDDEFVGYYSLKHEEKKIFLSKFYLDANYRGRGISRLMLKDIVKNKKQAESIYLKVNRNNTGPINVYKKMGFSIIGEEVTDIGEGHKMDDYIMERVLI